MHLFRGASFSAWLVGAGVFAGVVLTNPFTGSAATVETGASNSRPAHAHDVESRIKTLHNALHITPDQEAAWKNVADAMRENAKAMDELRSQQAKDELTATAPNMINAYGKSTDAHADAIKKFAAAFDPLYEGMPPAQKKTADTVFRRRVNAAANRHARPKS